MDGMTGGGTMMHMQTLVNELATSAQTSCDGQVRPMVGQRRRSSTSPR
jgi:hypothetical protein